MTQSGSDIQGIDGLASLLHQAKLDLGAEDVMDLLWLASHMGELPTRVVDSSGTQAPFLSPPSIREEFVDGDDEANGDNDPDPALPLVLPKGSSGKQKTQKKPIDGMPFKAPAAPALRTRLELARSLRPLRRSVPSPVRTVFDEAATVARIADQGIASPVLTPAPERWLDLALVVEETRATPIWQETIAEFQSLAERQGAFRTVTTWRLVASTAQQPQLFPSWKGSIQAQRPHSYKQLWDPAGRRLVLVMSDCTSELWQAGTMHVWLKKLGTRSPFAVVQLLPNRLWTQTGLGQGLPVRLRASGPGKPTAKLKASSLMPFLSLFQSAGKDTSQITIPVFTLDEDPLKQWAKMLGDAGSNRAIGVQFDKERIQESEFRSQNSGVRIQESEFTAEDRVKHFRETASLMAQRLAGLMAAAPVNPPIVDLIRQTLLRKAKPTHVAEVFMGGLMEASTSGDGEQDQKGAKSAVYYDFAEGVRDLLLQTISMPQAEKVLDTISGYISKRIGLSTKSFEALLAYDYQSDPDKEEMVLPFAQVTKQVLRRMGGDYGLIADRLETVSKVALPEAEPDPNDLFPLLQSYRFREATLSFDAVEQDVEENEEFSQREDGQDERLNQDDAYDLIESGEVERQDTSLDNIRPVADHRETVAGSFQDDYQRAIALIHSKKPGLFIGYAFLVRERVLVTTGRLVAAAFGVNVFELSLVGESLQVEFPYDEEFEARSLRQIPPRLYSAQIVYGSTVTSIADSSDDIVCLQLDESPRIEPLTLTTMESHVGDPCQMLGFDLPKQDRHCFWFQGEYRGEAEQGLLAITMLNEVGRAEVLGSPVWNERLHGVVGMSIALSNSQDFPSIPSRSLLAISARSLEDSLKNLENGVKRGEFRKRLEQQHSSITDDVERYRLTPREQEVWQLRRQGKSYQEISAQLRVSLNTVKKHLKNINAKRRFLDALGDDITPEVFTYETASITTDSKDTVSFSDAVKRLNDVLGTQLLSSRLSDIQVTILRGAWQGKSYEEMAEKSSYNVGKLRQFGGELWRQLSEFLGMNVTKATVRRVLTQSALIQGEPELLIRRRRGQAWQFIETLNDALSLEMVFIPEGTFTMGSPEDEEGRTDDEGPQHKVTISSFFMSKYPITQAQWHAVSALPQVEHELPDNPSRFSDEDDSDQRPVEKITWYQAVEFCVRLSQSTGREYRLPSESEWEYACRAGTTTPFYFSETITSDLANYYGQDMTYGNGPEGISRGETTPVGSFPANAFGLYDMHGNVWEWCADHWHGDYTGAPGDDSIWLSIDESTARVLRGGSWGIYPENCRSATRLRGNPDNGDSNIGLRVVCAASGP